MDGSPLSRRQFVAGASSLGAVAVFAPQALAAKLGTVPTLRGGRFDSGLMSGDPTPNGITLWTRVFGVGGKGSVELEIAKEKSFRRVVKRELIGTDHAEIGGWTLEEWRLPGNIIESVARHHSFDPDTYHARKTAVIHVADVLATAIDYRGPAWEKVPALELTALETLRFTQGELKDLLLTIMKMPYEPIIL